MTDVSVFYVWTVWYIPEKHERQALKDPRELKRFTLSKLIPTCVRSHEHLRYAVCIRLQSEA